MKEINTMLFSLRSMTVYRGLLKDKVIEGLTALLDEEERTASQAAYLYGAALSALLDSGMSLPDYIYSAALYDDNRFTRMCAQGLGIPGQLYGAVRHDLRALGRLAYVTPESLKAVMKARFPSVEEAVDALPEYSVEHERYHADTRDWANEMRALGDFCRENGYGEYARCRLCDAQGETMQRLLDNCDTAGRKMIIEKLKAL